MAISIKELFDPVVAAIREVRANQQNCKILTLGYPDVLFTKAQLQSMFGKELIKNAVFHPNNEGVWRWHGYHQHQHEPMIDAISLFHCLGATHVEVVDIVASRNVERIVNLNTPMPPDLLGQFDIAIDPGTTEHCFNFGQAIKNLAESVCLGGYIFTSGPMNMYNHGFFSFNPTLYIDFYGQNGFKILSLYGVGNSKIFDLNTTDRFNKAPEGATIGAIVKRIKLQNIIWPTQTKYLKNSALIS